MEIIKDLLSIIFVHYATNEYRSNLMKESIESLLRASNGKYELIVIDNGNSLEDSKYLLEKTQEKEITHYIRNADNLWFGYARNQGLVIATGEYICIVDNDLLYKKGWIDESLKVLKFVKGQKLFVTPLVVDRAHLRMKYFREQQLEIDGKKLQINIFAGSNCWFMHREDFDKLGKFINHPIAGTKWAQHYAKNKYAVVVLHKPLVEHKGLLKTSYQGYSKHKKDLEKIRILKYYINREEEVLYPH